MVSLVAALADDVLVFEMSEMPFERAPSDVETPGERAGQRWPPAMEHPDDVVGGLTAYQRKRAAFPVVDLRREVVGSAVALLVDDRFDRDESFEVVLDLARCEVERADEFVEVNAGRGPHIASAAASNFVHVFSLVDRGLVVRAK